MSGLVTSYGNIQKAGNRNASELDDLIKGNRDWIKWAEASAPRASKGNLEKNLKATSPAR